MGKQKFNTLPDYNISRPLGRPKYKVIYHINNDELNIDRVPVDTKAYSNGDVATILEFEYPGYYTQDGLFWCEFSGWAYAENASTVLQGTDTRLIEDSDVHLYAQWSKSSTLQVDSHTQTITGFIEHANMRIPRLVIPEYHQGIRLVRLGGAFEGINIDEIVIPPSIHTIEGGAFYGWNGTSLQFVDAPVSIKYPALTLEDVSLGALNNVARVVLPYRWRYYDTPYLIESYERVLGEPLQICIRNRKAYMEELNDGLELDTDIAGVKFIWGYNE